MCDNSYVHMVKTNLEKIIIIEEIEVTMNLEEIHTVDFAKIQSATFESIQTMISQLLTLNTVAVYLLSFDIFSGSSHKKWPLDFKQWWVE